MNSKEVINCFSFVFKYNFGGFWETSLVNSDHDIFVGLFAKTLNG